MQDEMWLANYLLAYDDLLYRAYSDKTSGEQFAADCRALKQGMTSKQLLMASIFESMGTFKILHEEAERWGETRQCRQAAWEIAVEMLQRLEAVPIRGPLPN